MIYGWPSLLLALGFASLAALAFETPPDPALPPTATPPPATALPAAPARSPAAITQPNPTDGFLRWNRSQRRVDADLNGWPLRKALEKIAAATGWAVLVEPGLESRIAARFSQRPEREALSTLLADVNYALVPSPNGPSRLLVFRSNSDNATVSVRPTPDPDPESPEAGVLDKELIVRLKKGARESIHDLAKRLGARVAGSIDSLDAHRLVFDDAEAADRARNELASSENVESVESNYAIGSPTRMERATGLQAPVLGLKARPIQDGSTVVVALIDTAVPSSGLTHADFLLPGVSVAGDVQPGTGLSHGPAMFETVIQGLALTQASDTGQPVRVLPIDVYGGRSETSSFEVAQGVVVALEKGADILNLSLAGPTSSPILHDVLQQASQAGVVAFAAPGNQPTTEPNYPAAYPEVVAVTASDRRGSLAPYANRGDFVDLIAPGTSVIPFQGESFVVNGTSVATAYTAGLAAGLLADSGKPAAEIVRQLKARIGFTPPKPTGP